MNLKIFFYKSVLGRIKPLEKGLSHLFLQLIYTRLVKVWRIICIFANKMNLKTETMNNGIKKICLLVAVLIIGTIVAGCDGLTKQAVSTVDSFAVDTDEYDYVDLTPSNYYPIPISEFPQKPRVRREPTPDDAYDEGYYAGEEQGQYDGRHGYSHGHNYDDGSDYYDYYETKYQEGYQNGYDDGYSNGQSEYEDEQDGEDEDVEW